MSFKIQDRAVGSGSPCYVIAEGGLNHNGDVQLAVQLMEAAHGSGADAIKFQKRSIDRIMTAAALNAPYGGVNSFGDTYRAHREHLELSPEAWARLFDEARRIGITCFGSVWDEESADFLDRLGAPVFKIPSADLTNLPLLRHVAAKGKPVILSSGMSSLEEVDQAVAVALELNADVALLHCVSTYPLENNLANLRAIPVLESRYPDLVIGYSGHEKSGIVVSLSAAALGAHVLERHLTLDHTMKGPDQAASLEPNGLRNLIQAIRIQERAMGDGSKEVLEVERPVRAKLVKSVTAATRIQQGDLITREMLTLKSPGWGLTGADLENLLGRTAQVELDEDDQLPLEALDWPRV